MVKIGILSGGGKLPLAIGKSLINKKFEIIFFCIDKYCDLKLYKNLKHTIISINSLTKIIKKLPKIFVIIGRLK